LRSSRTITKKTPAIAPGATKLAPSFVAGMTVLVVGITALTIGPLLTVGDEPPVADNDSRAAESDVGLPRPQVESNCVTCHLTAGRELTDVVYDFAHSIHDMNELSCSDCHGGNTDDDVTAHDEQFDFIGTKLSAHIETCGECHSAEAERLAKSAHHWDFSKKINLDYPTCIDCHGNHDVGNPPEDFRLREMCGDCHEDDEAEAAGALAVTTENDLFWIELIKARAAAGEDALPERLQTDIDALRATTMQYMHAVGNTTPDEAARVQGETRRLAEALRAWLKENG
jgi:formate-dependent nitrite reductase cytochrome c552 subunit